MIDEIKREIEAGTIFPFVRVRLGNDIDLSISPADAADLLVEWLRSTSAAKWH